MVKALSPVTGALDPSEAALWHLIGDRMLISSSIHFKA